MNTLSPIARAFGRNPHPPSHRPRALQHGMMQPPLGPPIHPGPDFMGPPIHPPGLGSPPVHTPGLGSPPTSGSENGVTWGQDYHHDVSPPLWQLAGLPGPPGGSKIDPTGGGGPGFIGPPAGGGGPGFLGPPAHGGPGFLGPPVQPPSATTGGGPDFLGPPAHQPPGFLGPPIKRPGMAGKRSGIAAALSGSTY